MFQNAEKILHIVHLLQITSVYSWKVSTENKSIDSTKTENCVPWVRSTSPRMRHIIKPLHFFAMSSCPSKDPSVRLPSYFLSFYCGISSCSIHGGGVSQRVTVLQLYKGENICFRSQLLAGMLYIERNGSSSNLAERSLWSDRVFWTMFICPRSRSLIKKNKNKKKTRLFVHVKIL